jgi:sugar phosphate isomerase/epimerase
MIPFHRVRAIRNIKTGEDIYARKGGVPYPLEEIQGHEGLGDFQDRAHHPHTVETKSCGPGAIECGARLSFPETRVQLFSERVKDALRLGMVELSFFEYGARSDESENYRSMLRLADGMLSESGLRVCSLHLPNADILHEPAARELLSTFLPFCSSVDCRSIVVHPARAKCKSGHEVNAAKAELVKVLNSIAGELEQRDITLSIETYHGKERILSGASDIQDFLKDLPLIYRIAYDTSHTTGETDDVIEDITHNIGKINVFHLSNRSKEERHIPVFDPRGELDFRRIVDAIKSSGFDGMLFLEYQPSRYRMLVERDLKSLRSMIENSGHTSLG